MSGDPMCPAGGICMRFCMDGCSRQRPPPAPFTPVINPFERNQERRKSSHLQAANEQMRAKIRRLEAEIANHDKVSADHRRAAVRAAVDDLLVQRAELRGDVAALWLRLGDVLSLFSGAEMMSAEQQDKLRLARTLHALWVEVPDDKNGGGK